MTAPRMILVSDRPNEATVAVFGGPLPSWAIVLSQEKDFTRAPQNASTRAFAVLYDRNSPAALLWEKLRAWDLVTGLTAEDCKGLKASIEKIGRRFGEPAASILLAGAEAA